MKQDEPYIKIAHYVLAFPFATAPALCRLRGETAATINSCGPTARPSPLRRESSAFPPKRLGQHLGVEVETTNSIGMVMRLIPPGEFLMGTRDAEILRLLGTTSDQIVQDHIRFDGPQHRVSIPQPFLMSVFEVTRGQFRAFVEDTGYKTDAEKDGKGGYALQDGKWAQDQRFSFLGFRVVATVETDPGQAAITSKAP